MSGLKSQLDAIAQNTAGRFGYSLHHLKTGARLERLGAELFSTDSTLKIAIMCAAMEPITSGRAGYHALRKLVS